MMGATSERPGGQSVVAATVLYFSSVSHIQGGAVQLMFRKARWLHRQGGTPVVVLPQAGEIVEWYTREGIAVQIVPFVALHRRWSLAYLVKYLLSTISIVFRLVRLIKRQKVDIVHVNEITYYPGLIAGKIAGIKTVCHVRAILIKPGWVRWALSSIARLFSDRILCESEAVRTRMFPRASSRVQTLYPPGADLRRFVPQTDKDAIAHRHRLGIPPDDFVVGLVSKFSPSKGHLALVEASRAIKMRTPQMRVRYLVVGGEIANHRDYYVAVRDLIGQYGLQDAFVLTGPRSNVPDLISACDVMVHLPNHEDPFPGVVLEAMAMEKPVIAFISGGTPEQFEDGKSGLLVEKNNIDSLVESLLALSRDRERRQQMGKEARRFLLSHYTPDRFFSELSLVYQDLLDEPR